MKKTITAHIVSHSHWDREWRTPIWTSRVRLATMFESLLDKFKNSPEYKAYLLDGQYIAIEDYLDWYPEMEDEIKCAVKEGKLFIGPWYNLPDEYPVTAEALVRNLARGIKLSDKMGGAMRIGYTSFGWGQTAQLPQIYSGFGIDSVVLGKHVSAQRAPQSEFIWSSPDGTKVFTTRLGKSGRANFYFNIVLQLYYGKNYSAKDWGYNPEMKGWFVHTASPDNYFNEEQFYPEFNIHNNATKASLEEYLGTCEDTVVKDVLFAGDGCDFTGPTQSLKDIIKLLNNDSEQVEFKHSTIADYLKEIRSRIDNNKLVEVTGELRDGPVSACSANALAVRMPIKLINRRAENYLIRYAEPFSIFSGLDNSVIIERAWDYLLRSHSHDAINGVTLDKTADDVTYRLNQVEELSSVAFDMSAIDIMKNIDIDSSSEEILLTVFNPVARAIETVVEAVVDIPYDWNAKNFKAEDSEGNVLAVVSIDCWEQTVPVAVYNSRALPYSCSRHRIKVETGIVPAMGYKVIKIQKAASFDRKAHFWQDDIETKSLMSASRVMENEYVRIEVLNDGTYTIFNKETGRKFDGLGEFEDTGDCGNYWQAIRPLQNKTITSGGSSCYISLVESNHISSSIVIERNMLVPADSSGRKRSDRLVEMPIKTVLTLYANSARLDVKTTIVNNAKSHCFKVLFPTFMDCRYSYAEGHFTVDKRLIERDFDSSGNRFAHMDTLPMQRFVAVSSETEGIAIINKGLTEYQVSDNASRTISLTLLRCVPVNICSEYRCGLSAPQMQGSQCLGEHTFEYAIYPFEGKFNPSKVYEQTELYTNPCRVYQMSAPSGNRKLPAEKSFFEIISAPLQLAAIKAADNGCGIVVRLFNPSDSSFEGEVKFAQKPVSVQLCRLDEQPIDDACIDVGGVVRFAAFPQKIITINVKF